MIDQSISHSSINQFIDSLIDLFEKSWRRRVKMMRKEKK